MQKDLSFVSPPIARIYYINPQDGNIWRISTSGKRKKLIVKSKRNNPESEIFLKKSSDNKHWDLLSRIEDKEELIKKNFINTNPSRDVYNGTFNEPRHIENLKWKLRFEFTDSRVWGLRVFNKFNPEESYVIALKLSRFRWDCKNEILYSKNQAIFQLGKQLMLINLKQKTIGFVCMGESPIIVLDNSKKD